MFDGFLESTKRASYRQGLIAVKLIALFLALFSFSGCSLLVPNEDNKEITIDDFGNSEYIVNIGETKFFSVSISPKDLTLEDLIISVSNPDVISVSDQTIEKGWFGSSLTFKITADKEGNSTIQIKSADGTVSATEALIHAEIPTKVTGFGEFKGSRFSIDVGETYKLSWHIAPNGLSREDITLCVQDNTIAMIEEVSFADDEKNTLFVFKVIGLAEGETTIHLESSNGKVKSQELTCHVDPAPIISAFEDAETTSVQLYVGETYTVMQYIYPQGTSREDFTLHNSDESVIGITENSFGDEGDATVFVYTVEGIALGNASIQLISSDNRTRSKSITFHPLWRTLSFFCTLCR